jgi:DNA invertase Pin-like site-specific DNA recombinase
VKKTAAMGMKIGYAEVSSSRRKLTFQMDRMIDCHRILYEKASNATARNSPGLRITQDFVSNENIIVASKLDLLARSVLDLTGIVQRSQVKNLDLVVLDQGIDTTTMYSSLQFFILAAPVFSDCCGKADVLL